MTPPLLALVLGILLVAASNRARAQSESELRARLAAGDAAQVLATVRERVRGDRAEPGIVLVGAEAALELGEFGEARSLADLAEKLAPEDPRPYLMNGHALFNMAEAQTVGRAAGGGVFARATFQDAATYYRLAREHGADTPENTYFQAEAAFNGGAFDDALAVLAPVASPDHPALVVLEARILLATGEAGKTLEVLKPIREKLPTRRDAAILDVEAALRSGDPGPAREVFLRAVRDLPEDRGIYDPFVERYQVESPPTFLRTTMEELRRTTPPERDRFPLFYLAEIAERDGKNEEALALFTQYRDVNPATPEGHLRVALALIRLGRLEEGRSSLLKANALGGLDPAALANGYRWLTAAQVGRRDFTAAVESQRLVVSLSEDPDDRLDLGVLLYNAGQREEGIATYRKILEAGKLLPRNEVRVMNYLALGLLGIRRGAEGEELLRRAIELSEGDLANPAAIDARENLGILLLQSGRKEEGERWLEKVLAASPAASTRNFDRARYHLLRSRNPGTIGAGLP